MQFEAHRRNQPGTPFSLAVFGGSFNPVHEGHLEIVRALAVDPTIDSVWVLPARRSPFKPDHPQLPDTLRWEMLHHVFSGLPGVVLSDLELRHPPPSFTFHTLNRLASLLPRADLQFVMGWDAFTEFRHWYRAADILTPASLLVFDRAGEDAPTSMEAKELASMLPPPFDERAVPDGSGRLLTPEGRVLLRRRFLPLPEVSGRTILRDHRLESVPLGARALLEDHWRTTGEI